MAEQYGFPKDFFVKAKFCQPYVYLRGVSGACC